MTNDEKATKVIKKPEIKYKPVSRVETCYEWASKRQNVHTDRFFEK